MNTLQTFSEIKFMSSLEVAQLCEKRHADVIRDIRVMLKQLDDANLLHDKYQEVKDERNYTSEFLLSKKLCLNLVSGYSAPFRMIIINRWDELENQKPVLPMVEKVKPSVVNSAFRSFLSMAKLIGLEGNQAIISADKAVRKVTGESPLQLLDATHLHAPVQEVSLTPKQIGEMLTPSISAQKVNQMLKALGFQDKQSNVWMATPVGRSYCEVLDTGKQHSDGTPVKQIKWYQSVIEKLVSFGGQSV